VERQNSKTQLRVGIFFALVSATCCISDTTANAVPTVS
jgi:hypothetical protein